MKNKFNMEVRFVNDVWLIDCDYLNVYGEAMSFKEALKSFIVDLKGARKFYKETKKIDLMGSEIKMKKRFKKLG